MTTWRFLLLATASSAVPACSDLADLRSLQRGLAAQFSASTVNVNVNNGVQLTVMLANSRAASFPDSEREVFARRVAEYVRDHYPKYDRLQMVRVGFTKVARAGALSVTSSSVPYSFTRQDLGSPNPTPARAN